MKRTVAWQVTLLVVACLILVGYGTPPTIPASVPTPAFSRNLLVWAAGPDSPAVVYQLDEKCEIVRDSDSRVLDRMTRVRVLGDTCFNRPEQQYYMMVRLPDYRTGWVAASSLATSPPPTPSPTASAPSDLTTELWEGVYIGMSADDVLRIHPKSEAWATPCRWVPIRRA